MNWPRTAVINTCGQIGKQRIGANQWISIILEGINSFFFTSVHRFLSISVDIKIHLLSIFTIGQVGMGYGKILTGLLDHFLDYFFFKHFFGPTFGPFVSDHLLGGGQTISTLGVVRCSLSVLSSGRQTFVTEEGVEDELLVCRKGWEVVVLVTATDKYMIWFSCSLTLHQWIIRYAPGTNW